MTGTVCTKCNSELTAEYRKSLDGSLSFCAAFSCISLSTLAAQTPKYIHVHNYCHIKQCIHNTLYNKAIVKETQAKGCGLLARTSCDSSLFLTVVTQTQVII